MIDPLLEGLADPDPEKRRRAVFGVLSHRRHDLLPALYELAMSEKDRGLAVLATQVALTLRSAPPDPQREALIERAFSAPEGLAGLGEQDWEYLETAGTRRQRLHALSMLARGGVPPRPARGFVENCLGHCDPDVRAAACRPAVATGNGRLLAWVLAAIEDPDAGVGREAFAAVRSAPRETLYGAIDEALADPDEWVPDAVAAFLPVLADELLRETIVRGCDHALPQVAAQARDALARLDARKLASRSLPPAPPLPKTPEPVFELKLAPPLQEPPPAKPVPSAAPPGPLPWAHLVSPSSQPASPIPSPGRRNSAIDEAGAPFAGAPPASLAEETSVPVKRERVISMRNRIVAGSPEKSPERSQETLSRPPDVEPVPVRVAPVAPPAPPAAVAPATISSDIEPAPVLETDVWEAVSIDVAQPREPRLAVQLEPPPSEEAAVPEMSAVDEISVLDESEVSTLYQGGAIALEKPPMIDTILVRYPSFITTPLARFFAPAEPAALMETLRAAIDPLIAFLSFTFLQTYLFSAGRTPKGDQAAKDALKAHFTGPTAVRLLHHLSLAVKEVPGDAFFTTGLARAMSEAAEDVNPLFMLREVTEFLKTPPTEAADGLSQVAAGLPALLASCKGILQNAIALRLPPGAREPYLNLSGPQSCPLAAAERPGLDLPSNEIVVLSKDRSEALGLFPYFGFDGQTVKFRTPSDAEFKTLLERLDLAL